MPFAKVEYGSSHNVSVQGIEYLEITADDLDDDGDIRPDLIDSIWQEAVNEFMADTCVTLVDEEGD